MKTVAVILLVICGSFVLLARHIHRPSFSFSLGRSKAEDVIEKSFKVGSGGVLTVASSEGSIDVQSSLDDAVSIRVVRRVEARGEDEAQRLLKQIEIDFAQNGNDVRVSSRSPNRGNRRVEFHITVPRVYNADLRTSGGSVSVEGIRGEVHGRTSGGSLKFIRIDGPVKGETSGGSITASDITGQVLGETSGGSITIKGIGSDAVVDTSGGSITAEQIAGSLKARTSGGSLRVSDITGVLDARTSGGSVTARIPVQPSGDCRLETSGGSITVYLPESVSLRLDAEARSGHVITDFPIAMTVQGKLDDSALRGNINSGGPLLYCRTTGSNIQLRKLSDK